MKRAMLAATTPSYNRYGCFSPAQMAPVLYIRSNTQSAFATQKLSESLANESFVVRLQKESDILSSENVVK